MSEVPTRALSRAEERWRALIDVGMTLVITMLMWPFPIARAMLAPLTNVLLLLTSWAVISVLYHVVCARVWRRTAGMYLLGLSLCDANGPADECPPVDNRTALRWGFIAGLLALASVAWARVSSFERDLSGVELRSPGNASDVPS